MVGGLSRVGKDEIRIGFNAPIEKENKKKYKECTNIITALRALANPFRTNSVRFVFFFIFWTFFGSPSHEAKLHKLCQVFPGTVLANVNTSPKVNKLCQVFLGMVLANKFVDNENQNQNLIENDYQNQYHFHFF